MACTLTRPSPQVLYNRTANEFSATVLGGGAIIPESLEFYVVANQYALQEQYFSIAAQQWRESDPRYACCDNLVGLASVDGVYPKPAGYSQGYIQLTGTALTPLPGVIQVQFDGQTYQSEGTVPAALDATGQIAFRVKAILPGADGNDAVVTAAGAGTLTTPIANVNNAVTSYGAKFCGGSEAESCEEFRARYLARKAYKPRATQSWIIEKIFEWPCVTRVVRRTGCCCDTLDNCGCGCGECASRLEFYVLFDDSFDCGIPPQCVIDDINTWLFGTDKGLGQGQVEIGICGTVYAPVASIINVRVDGLACQGAAQQTEINSALEEFFKTFSPSVKVTLRQIELVVAQIIGGASGFNVTFSVASGDTVISDCGDIVPACDVLPCLGTITFTSEVSGDCI